GVASDARAGAVAAGTPPYSADVYWNVTLAGMRRELAGLYGMAEEEMGREVHRITLEQALPHLRAPLMISGGGHDLITPGEEAWRIFGAAHCDRELVYYPRGGHDCFNMLSDLRPRMTSWLGRQLRFHLSRSRRTFTRVEVNGDGPHMAAEAVDLDFADALTGEAPPRHWSPPDAKSLPARWRPAAIAPRDSSDVRGIPRRAQAVPI